MKSKIAFGPFLVLGTAIVIIFHAVSIQLWNTIF
jgi:prepilin signal peptidase PulO-like enzyme (type II secretory pathway)